MSNFDINSAQKIKINHKITSDNIEAFIPYTKADAVIVDNNGNDESLNTTLTNIENSLTPNAEENQNAFSKIKVNNGGNISEIDSNEKTSTIELIAGNNVKIDSDINGRKITIKTGYIDGVAGKSGDVTVGVNDVSGAVSKDDLEQYTAYGKAKAAGYSGTKEEFKKQLAAIGDYAAWLRSI